MSPLNLLLLVGSALMLLLTIELVRRKHLREKYSILWLLTFSLFVAFSLSGHLIDNLAKVLKVGYPPSLIFIAGIFFLILLILMVSVIASHQTNRIIDLTQKIALLEKEIKDKSSSE